MQTITLQTAQDLYKLGLRVGADHKWIPRTEMDKKELPNPAVLQVAPDGKYEYFLVRKEIYSISNIHAYTQDELWGMLPEIIEMADAKRKLKIEKTKEHTRVIYGPFDIRVAHVVFHDINPAEACGLMLKWLLESKHVKVEEVNAND
jgi:hypothetical protein